MLDYNYLKKYEPITILGHKNADVDSLASCYLLKKLLSFHNIKSEILIEDNIIDPLYDFEKYKFDYKTTISNDDVLFLVDHLNEYQNKVVGCIDHHPSILSLDKNYIYKSQTSCAKIIADEMIKCEMNLSCDDIYLIVYSQYMDSLSFKSSKALQSDKLWCKEQIQKYNFDENFLYESGLCLNDISIIDFDAISYGLKNYDIAGKKISSSYITTRNYPKEKKQEIINMIRNNLNDRYGWLFIINVIDDNRTITYFITQKSEEINVYDKLLSRGKDLIPALTKKITNN